MVLRRTQNDQLYAIFVAHFNIQNTLWACFWFIFLFFFILIWLLVCVCVCLCVSLCHSANYERLIVQKPKSGLNNCAFESALDIECDSLTYYNIGTIFFFILCFGCGHACGGRSAWRSIVVVRFRFCLLMSVIDVCVCRHGNGSRYDGSIGQTMAGWP